MKTISKYHGSALGALIGDCLGAHYEMKSPVPAETLQKDTQYLTDKEHTGTNVFTDDTAMVRSVASSLVTRGKLITNDVAKRFTEEFYSEPERGYGASIGKVFEKLKNQQYSDPFGPASEQFDGRGSYGNGGAMRIYPAALYAANAEPKLFKETVTNITKITHSNVEAINGALLQAHAVQLALNQSSDGAVDTYTFLKDLCTYVSDLESPITAEAEGSPAAKRKTRRRLKEAKAAKYSEKLECIGDFLQREHVTVAEVEKHLGTDVSAVRSVPAAIYSFLRASQAIDGIETENAFERTIIYAISLGGDTDTIATMAGAIAGACYGIEAVPLSWQQSCEAMEEFKSYADKLFELNQNLVKTAHTDKQDSS